MEGLSTLYFTMVQNSVNLQMTRGTLGKWDWGPRLFVQPHDRLAQGQCNALNLC